MPLSITFRRGAGSAAGKAGGAGPERPRAAFAGPAGGYRDPPMPKRLVIVESPAKARTIAGYLGPDFIVESSVGHIRDLPDSAAEIPEQLQGRVVGAPRRRRRARLRAALRRRPRQEEDGRRAAQAARRRRRAPARDRRGSRGRGDRLAPARGAEAEGAGAADGLPRDHARGDRARPRRDARRRRAARRRAGVAAHPRPALRLRGLAGAVEEDHARALGRARPVGRDAPRRRARARADGVPRRRVAGTCSRRFDPRRGGRFSEALRGAARLPRRAAGRATGRDFGPDGKLATADARPARRGGGARPRRPAPGIVVPASRRVERKPYSRRPARRS